MCRRQSLKRSSLSAARHHSSDRCGIPAGDVDPPILEYPDWRCSGFADIRGQRSADRAAKRFRQRSSSLPETGGRSTFGRASQSRGRERPGSAFAGWLADRTAETDAGNLGAGVTGQGRHQKGIPHRHFLHDASHDLRHFACRCSQRLKRTRRLPFRCPPRSAIS
jgi:hypothetical protein